MVIHTLFKSTALGPEDIECLVAAYQRSLRMIGVQERDDPLTRIIAKRVIEIGQTGIRDPDRISHLVVKRMGLP